MLATFPAYFAISLHFIHKHLKIKYVLVAVITFITGRKTKFKVQREQMLKRIFQRKER